MTNIKLLLSLYLFIFQFRRNNCKFKFFKYTSFQIPFSHQIIGINSSFEFFSFLHIKTEFDIQLHTKSELHSLSLHFFTLNFCKSTENFKYLNIDISNVVQMSMNEKEVQRKNIQFVVQKSSKSDIEHLLAFFFETSKLPKIIMMSRKTESIDGFIILNKRTFKFSIIFWEKDNGIELRMKIKYGKQIIEKWENITISEAEYGLDIYLAKTKQYLFSIYF